MLIIRILILTFLVTTSFACNIIYNHISYPLRFIYCPQPIQFELTQKPVYVALFYNYEHNKIGLLEINGKLTQKQLIEQGKAIFYPDLNLDVIYFNQLSQTEKNTIKQKKGLWQDFQNYHIFEDGFAVVKAKILRINLYQNYFYINLDKVNNLTIKVPKEYIKLHKISLKKVKQLEGKIIMAKGWVKKYNQKLYLLPSNHLMLTFNMR